MRVLANIVQSCCGASGGNQCRRRHPAKKHPLAERFQKMDTNHDGLLTLAEFVAGHPKMGATKATAAYKELVTLGVDYHQERRDGNDLPAVQEGPQTLETKPSESGTSRTALRSRS